MDGRMEGVMDRGWKRGIEREGGKRQREGRKERDREREGGIERE
jgi:hypothetical protein